ncbi:alkene reductase [Vibrio fortis]|uniref:Alkene reductase n=1 Tax=Vibrio fortis TaxID=212667 RepID=A0A5N3QSZ8_9VIBR|nr:alkene reductase [Vibrio fortis]KAB0285326.1 alkene reductase [Vibrio fortis]
MKFDSLFTETRLGSHKLRNRFVLPPLTRSRTTQPGNIPNDMMAEYYAQRADAGFIITEATQVEPRAQGYAWTPGLHTEMQVEGWKKVTQAVHEKGGTIFAQLWHVGRVSHTSFQPNGEAPIAPSAVKADAVKVFIETAPGEGALAEPSEPRALTTGEVTEIVQHFATAAKNAIRAGFDGVEIHGANGYLVNQFLSDKTNFRDDQYGGSLENRLRFLKEIIEAVSAEIGSQRIGVRFAPLFESTDEDRIYLGLVEDDPHHTYLSAVKMLEKFNIAYISIAEADWDNAPDLPEAFCRDLRDHFSGTIMYAGKYTPEKAKRMLDAGLGDIFGFGRKYIANPDLPERIKNDWPLNPVDAPSLFGGSQKGYTDYPFYNESNA